MRNSTHGRPPGPALSGALLTATRMLALDVLALEVIGALQEASIGVLLMKGPVTSRLLFGDDPLGHPYTDIDLIVGPHDRDHAGSVLTDLGFRDFHGSVLRLYRPAHQSAWVAGEHVVDLHTGLWGVPTRNAVAAWHTLWSERESLELHGRTVSIFGGRARMLQLALHAAQRDSGPKAIADLERGLSMGSARTWGEAASLAVSLDATAVFAAGLGRATAGADLLARLGIDPRPTTQSVLHCQGASPEAYAIERLATLPIRDRPREVARWLTVSRPAYPRATLAADRLKVMLRLPKGLVQWWRARSISRASRW